MSVTPPPLPNQPVPPGAQPGVSGGAWGLTPGVFKTIFDCSPEAIVLIREHDGVLVEVNTEWLHLTGYTREEALGRTAVELGHWLDPSERERVFAPLHQGGRVVDADVTLVMKDRNPRVVRMNATQVHEQGEAYILLYLRDVTAERLAHEALRAGEQALEKVNDSLNRQVKLHELTESLAKVGHWVAYPGSTDLHISRGAAHIGGLGEQTLLRRGQLIQTLVPEDRPQVERALQRMDGEVVEYRWRRPDGELIWVRARFYQQLKDGVVQAEMGVIQEFTDEQRVRQSLENRLTFIHKITARAPGLVYEYQMWADGRFIFPFVSAGVEQIYGVTPEQVYADPTLLFRGLHPEDADLVRKTTQEAMVRVQPWQCEFRVIARDGVVRWMLGSSLPELQPDGSVLFCGSITDITPQKEAQERLRASEERFRSLSALSSDWYWEQDAEYRFVRIDGNGLSGARMASDAAIGHTRWDSGAMGVSEAQWEAHKAQVMAHETFHDFEIQRLLKDGTYMWASISGTPIFNAQGEFCGYLSLIHI